MHNYPIIDDENHYAIPRSTLTFLVSRYFLLIVVSHDSYISSVRAEISNGHTVLFTAERSRRVYLLLLLQKQHSWYYLAHIGTWVLVSKGVG